MKDEHFQELLESVRQGAAILRGELEPSRRFDLSELDVRTIRESLDLSQPRFAAMLGISVATLRNWEQGRRRPEGPARVLLQVAAKHPEAVLDTVATEMSTRAPRRSSTPTGSGSGTGKTAKPRTRTARRV
jgi:putative transcriptional regulator